MTDYLISAISASCIDAEIDAQDENRLFTSVCFTRLGNTYTLSACFPGENLWKIV